MHSRWEWVSTERCFWRGEEKMAAFHQCSGALAKAREQEGTFGGGGWRGGVGRGVALPSLCPLRPKRHSPRGGILGRWAGCRRCLNTHLFLSPLVMGGLRLFIWGDNSPQYLPGKNYQRCWFFLSWLPSPTVPTVSLGVLFKLFEIKDRLKTPPTRGDHTRFPCRVIIISSAKGTSV